MPIIQETERWMIMGKDLKGKELGKGISQRKDGRYEARIVINGKRIAIYGTNLANLKREFENLIFSKL